MAGRGVDEGKHLGNMTSQRLKSSHEVAVVDLLKARTVEKQREHDGRE